MATNDLDCSDVKKQEEIEDITTCCICTDVYSDPKALPCIHTFCMKCLREVGFKTNKGPGDEMPCPICRRLFKIPSDGFPGLPKHFFIERLIQVSKVAYSSTETKGLCHLCLEECKEQDSRVTPTADTYCVDCKYTLCEECCSEHKLFRATRNHKLIPTSEHESGQNVITDLAPIACEVHEQRFLDVYCANCKTVVCAICFIEDHKNHVGSHVNKCVDDFREQIKDNTETLTGCIVQAQTKKAELLVTKEQILELVGSLDSEIENRKEEIKQLADKHASSLLQSLYLDKQSLLKEIEMETDDIDTYLSHLESYNSYCRSLMVIGSASDICSALSDLSTRSTELQQQCQPIIERGIQEFKLCFRQSELEKLLEEECGNLVGEIKKEGDFQLKERKERILLADRSKEIDIMRQENVQLIDEIANYNAHIEKLMHELQNNKTTIIAIEVSKDKLQQELDELKKVSNSLKTSNEKEIAYYKALTQKLKQELEYNKRTINAIRTNSEKEKADNRTLIQKLKEELDKNKTTINEIRTNSEKEKADSRALTQKLKEELAKNKTASYAIRTNSEKENADNRALVRKLKQELEKNRTASYAIRTNSEKEKAQILKLREESENYLTEINALRAGNDVLKQKLDTEKMKNDSIQTNNDKLLQELDTSKLTVNTLEINAEKLRNVLVELQYKPGPALVQTIRATKAALEREKWIHGMTILDKELFVLSGFSSDVEVYDSLRFSFSRRWNLKELINPTDMVSCSRNRCLFIFDIKGLSIKSSEILKVDPTGKLIKKWSTVGDYGRLFVTDESHVAVTFHNKNKVIEYSSDGQFIREIDLSSGAGIRNPWHAIKLTNGHFVVSHGSYEDELHRVCIVDADGILKKSFGGKYGSTTGQMNRPGYLCIDRSGFVMVIDRDNSRVLLLDSDLKLRREILSKDNKHGLRNPLKILLDDSSGRLFVADNQSNNQRILIFDFK